MENLCIRYRTLSLSVYFVAVKVFWKRKYNYCVITLSMGASTLHLMAVLTGKRCFHKCRIIILVLDFFSGKEEQEQKYMWQFSSSKFN